MNNLDTTQCHPINLDKLSEHLRTELSQDEHEGRSYDFGYKWAVIPSKGVVCTELVGKEFNNGAVSLDIYENREGFLSTMPNWTAPVTETELMTLTDAPISVGEFVKDRRGYNARLESNEYHVNSWLGEK